MVGKLADLRRRNPHAELVGAHIDLSNYSTVFSRNTGRPFGCWRMANCGLSDRYRLDGLSPVIYHAIPENIVRGVAVVDVVVLTYYDDFFEIGYGKGHVGQQTGALAHAPREARAPVSPRSTLGPRSDNRWIGKEFDLSKPLICSDQGACRALWGCWLRLSVSFCSTKRSLRYLGRLHWEARPRWGIHPLVASAWAHVVLGSRCLPCTPLALLHLLVTALGGVRNKN